MQKRWLFLLFANTNMKIDIFYQGVTNRLLKEPTEINKRTGAGVRALPGITFQTDLGEEGFPLLTLRKIPLSFIPEMMWFLSGSDNINYFLNKHTKIWDSFAEFDGTVTSAYGARWAKNNQLWRAIQKLDEDPSSRHCVVITWDPEIDGVMPQKNVPCPYTFTLMIIDGRLHLHNIIRSNDFVLGFPTDVAGFVLLQFMIAQYLGVEPGVYTHSISNCHIYENQMEAIEEMMKRTPKTRSIRIELPYDSLQRACELDLTLLDELKNVFNRKYKPQAVIKNIPISK